MLFPHHDRVSALPATGALLRMAVVGWLLACAFGGVAAAQSGSDDAISFDALVTPEDLGPGDAFTIDGTVTVDPDAAGGGPLAWTLTIGPVAGATFDDAACGDAAGTTCEAGLNAGNDTVTVSGEVDTTPRGDVTTEVRITGSVDLEPGNDATRVTAATCGVVTATGGTDEADVGGRLSQGPAPEQGTPQATCAGVAGTVEVPITAPTPVPTEEPTEAPTVEPTETPTEAPTEEPTEEPTATATNEPTPTEEPTTEPTATPTAEPTPTTEPTATATATVEPTATATEEPTATPTQELTATATEQPTEESTATPTVDSTATATEEPSATATEAPSATLSPTTPATEEPTETPTASVTVEPTGTLGPTVTSTATTAPTEAARPTPDEGGDGNAGLWIGAGALALLAVAAGTVWYQRRKMPV